MNDLAREKLAKLVIIHGGAILEDARRCQSALRESCPECRREIGVLVVAHEAGVVARLRERAGETTPPDLAEDLARQIQAAMPVTDEAARWAVRTWASVMGPSDRPTSKRLVPPPAKSPPPLASDARKQVRPGRFVGAFLWSLVGGPIYAFMLLMLCWVVLPWLFMLLGALIDLSVGGFSAEAREQTSEAVTVVWRHHRGHDRKETKELFEGPAGRTATLWTWAVGGGMSAVLLLPVLAWSAVWKGPARGFGGLLIVVVYLTTLGAVFGAITGEWWDGRKGRDLGVMIGAAVLGSVALLVCAYAWLRSLMRAARA